MTPDLARQLSQARASLQNGDPALTMRLCRSALTSTPDNPAALAMLAEAARIIEDYESAVDALQKLARLAPEQPGVFLSLGRALVHLQRHAEALAAFERCTELDANNAEAVRRIGTICAREGDTTRAVDAMRKALAIDERDSAAHYQLTTLTRAEPDDPRPKMLKELYARDGFSNRERSRLAFALARIRDQQGNYNEAFQWFQTANKLRLQDDDLNSEANEAWIQSAIETFSDDLFSQHAASGSAATQPVLIVGMPRSGSTLLEQVLASHPDVHGAGELMLLPETVAGLGQWLSTDDRLPEAAAKLGADAWRELGDRYSEALRKHAPQAQRVVDKQLFNYTLVGFARLMLPGARVVHTSRHPMATCWSCYTTAFRNNRGFTADLTALGETWRKYRRIMDHWHETLPDYLLEVRYEDMLDDLEGTARRVLEFVGLPWNDQCLEFYKTERTVMTASKTQVRKPLYKGSRDHWRNYEVHLGPLREAMRLAGD